MSLACKNCGCRHCPVTDTRKKQVTFRGVTYRIVRRRRVCRNCGLPFWTNENYEDEDDIPDQTTPEDTDTSKRHEPEPGDTLPNPYL